MSEPDDEMERIPIYFMPFCGVCGLPVQESDAMHTRFEGGISLVCRSCQKKGIQGSRTCGDLTLKGHGKRW